MHDAMTEDQAIALYESEWWTGRQAREIVQFQLFTDLLCMPFDAFHSAVEEALGRPVWTHEFGSLGVEGLKKEFLGEKDAPSLQEIMDIMPADKRVIVTRASDQGA